MDYNIRYREDAKKFAKLPADKKTGYTIETQSPSNIALVKYWGKRFPQLPQNPSISFTLSESKTSMTIRYSYTPNRPENFVRLFFEGERNPAFEKRIQKYLQSIEDYLPYLAFFEMEITSSNTFPHSSGIASSASSMSALALNLCTFEERLFGPFARQDDFLAKASFLARLASGSASRSVYPGYTIWGKSPYVAGSHDEIAIPLPVPIHAKYQNLQDRILITASGKKAVSSSAGHSLMDAHPYRECRYRQAHNNVQQLCTILSRDDWEAFSNIVEEEAMSIHALMMNSRQAYTLMNENTWNILTKLREIRQKEALELTYTLDAGPNVHIIFPAEIKREVDDIIEDELKRYCQNSQIIRDYIKK